MIAKSDRKAHEGTQIRFARNVNSHVCVHGSDLACPAFGWVCLTASQKACHVYMGGEAIDYCQPVPSWRRMCSTSRCNAGILLITASHTMS